MTTRDIRAQLREMYDVEVSPGLISRVTGAVVDELAEWQARPLDRVYPVVFTGALMIKVRDGVVTNRPVYLAIGIDCDGRKQVLGLWIGPTTGVSAKFWLTVLSELKSRGVADVCIVCCDGLTGLPEAISVTWPQAVVQPVGVVPAAARAGHLRAPLVWRAAQRQGGTVEELATLLDPSHAGAAGSLSSIRDEQAPDVVTVRPGWCCRPDRPAAGPHGCASPAWSAAAGAAAVGRGRRVPVAGPRPGRRSWGSPGRCR